jgi:hypothetical protein
LLFKVELFKAQNKAKHKKTGSGSSRL